MNAERRRELASKLDDAMVFLFVAGLAAAAIAVVVLAAIRAF